MLILITKPNIMARQVGIIKLKGRVGDLSFAKVVASIWLVPKVELMGTVSRPIHDLREPGKWSNFNVQ